MPRVEDILNEANNYMLTSKNICNIEVINNNNVKSTIKKKIKRLQLRKQYQMMFFFRNKKTNYFGVFILFYSIFQSMI